MRAHEFITEKWTEKYKKSINCSSPKGFSQKAHCAGRKKNEDVAEEASPMIKPPVNRFDNKQEAFAHAKQHGGKVFKSTYTDPNTGMKNITFVVKQEQDVSKDLDEDLRKWFKDKWVRFGPDGKIRGDCARGSSKEGKPKCLPKSKAQSLGKKGRAKAAARKRRQDPNANRSGKAINVKTK